MRVFVAVAALVILLLIPLIVNPGLRLDLAHRLDLVPGSDVEQLSGGEGGIRLIVAPIEIKRPNTRSQYRFRAIYLAREGPEGVELTAIDTGAKVSVPLQVYDFVSAAPDAMTLLFQDRRDPSAIRSALVDVATGSVTALPAASPFPRLPGKWTEPVWAQTIGICDGISPNAAYIACFQKPELASYLAGDWELQVRVYGDVERKVPVYRGEGFLPIAGWSSDDRWLYFQNEHGVWRAEITDDLFPPGDRTA